MEDREDISRGLAKGPGNKDIAASIGRDESAVSLGIARHGGARGVSCMEGRRGRAKIAKPPEGG
jgi:IS30 family transposase